MATMGCEAEKRSVRTGPIGPEGKQILFGDLHSHTTYSADAYAWSLHAAGGPGFSPPTKACNFARYCSQLDFWSINDHAEQLLPVHWQDTKDTIRTCNEMAGGNSFDPDMVSFLGWEWTQMGDNAAENYGHKNVILLDTAEDSVPKRPIVAVNQGSFNALIDLAKGGTIDQIVQLASVVDPTNKDEYEGIGSFLTETVSVPVCPDGVDTRELPDDCREQAKDPATLFEKLSQWGFETLVIPHGTSWGLTHPPLTDWTNQLNATQHNPDMQRIIEVYSGHGNSEEYRSWTPFKVVDGINVCPEPTMEYLPCCWRAGELTGQKNPACIAEPGGSICAETIRAAQEKYMSGGNRPQRGFPEIEPEEWLDCGQCRDCFQPAFRYEPGSSVQASLAEANFDDPAKPIRYEFGFIGSTDEHRGTPGVGYREDKRFTDSSGPASPELEGVIATVLDVGVGEWERQGSFWFAGSLAAVHSVGRSRQAIWDALKRKETYATSGERILLWFYLEDAVDGTRHPMGSKVSMSRTPSFEVSAVGAFKQEPECPREVVRRAPDEFVENSCFGECYNPTDDRYLITRIEIVRIRAKVRAGESLDPLIEDPWKVIECSPSEEGCRVEFSDPEYAASGRPHTYYVRAIQEPTLQVNAGGLRCETDAQGECVAVRPCYPGYRSSGDDCLDLDEERAWSSPIFLHPE